LIGFGRRQDDQFDLSARGFPLHLFHHRQCTCARPDNEPFAFPRNLFFDGQRGVPVLITILLRWLLLTFANCTAVDHHVALVGDAIDAYGTE
jgi:hypothetical protein